MNPTVAFGTFEHLARQARGGFAPHDPSLPGVQTGPASTQVPESPDAMLRDLSADSEGFAYGSTALAAALNDRHLATVAAFLPGPAGEPPALSRWECRFADRRIELIPIVTGADRSTGSLAFDADALLGKAGPGDVLIACDPGGDNELLCWTLRMASYRRVTTVAITHEQPSLLAVLATHAVRVPAPVDARDAFVAAALHCLVQTAGSAMESGRRRATTPLNAALL